MKIGGKKIGWTKLFGAGKILIKGLVEAYLNQDQGEDLNVVSWRELTFIILEVATYLELPVDTKGLKIPEYLHNKVASYM